MALGLCCASEMHILSCGVTMMKSFEADPPDAKS